MKALIFQHLEAEHPGYIGEYLTQDAVDWSVVHLYAGDSIPDLTGVDALFVLGGPMDVWQESRHMWLADEKKALQDAVRTHDIPTLGISLGHQLLASALGGTVQKMQTPEIGLFEVEMTSEGAADPLLYGIDATSRVFQWHSSEVVSLPEGAAVLAASQSCAIQAVRYSRNAYGIQFHPEMTAQQLSALAADPAYAESLKSELGDTASDQIIRLAGSALDLVTPNGRRLYENFMTIVREGALLHEVSPDLKATANNTSGLSSMELAWKP